MLNDLLTVSGCEAGQLRASYQLLTPPPAAHEAQTVGAFGYPGTGVQDTVDVDQQ